MGNKKGPGVISTPFPTVASILQPAVKSNILQQLDTELRGVSRSARAIF